MSSRFLIVAAMGCLPFLGALTAARAAEPGALSIDVELAERAGKDAPEISTDVALAISGEHGCAEMSLSKSTLSYQIKVCRDGGTVGAPILSFTIERVEREGDGDKLISARKFKLGSRVSSGKRILIGRLLAGDGASTQITAGLL